MSCCPCACSVMPTRQQTKEARSAGSCFENTQRPCWHACAVSVLSCRNWQEAPLSETVRVSAASAVLAAAGAITMQAACTATRSTAPAPPSHFGAAAKQLTAAYLACCAVPAGCGSEVLALPGAPAECSSVQAAPHQQGNWAAWLVLLLHMPADAGHRHCWALGL